MKNKEERILQFLELIQDPSVEIQGFSVDLLQNAFVVSLILIREQELMGTDKSTVSFAFENDSIEYADIINPIVGVLNTYRP